MLRPTVSRPVYLGVKPHLGLKTRSFVTVGQLRVCLCGAPFLTRGLLCHLQLLLVLASAVILVSESCGTHNHILLRFETSPTSRIKSPYLSLRNRVAQLYPQALGSISVASYDSQGYGGGIRTRLHIHN
jgi:hypothetical protein